MERRFGAINSDILHALRGNTRIARDARSMDPALDPRDKAIWPFHELVEAVRQRDAMVEETRVIQGLGMTTNDAWDRRHEHGMRSARLLRWSTHLERDLGVTHPWTPEISNVKGIWVNRLYYWHEVFSHPVLEPKKEDQGQGHHAPGGHRARVGVRPAPHRQRHQRARGMGRVPHAGTHRPPARHDR